MDDRTLRELLHRVADDPPPAGFEAGDIAARARRTGHPRQRMLAGVATAVSVVIAAAIVVPVMLLGPGQVDTAAPAVQHGLSARGDTAHDKAGRVGPQVMGRAGTCPVDRGLAAALADQLALPAGSRTVPVPGGCPAGGRGAAYRVGGGTVSAVLLPAGTRPRTAEAAEVRTAGSGATLVVTRTPGSRAAPMTAPLSGIADRLATRF